MAQQDSSWLFKAEKQVELSFFSLPEQEMGPDKWLKEQVVGVGGGGWRALFSQCVTFGGISFLYIRWPKYTKSKSPRLRAFLSAAGNSSSSGRHESFDTTARMRSCGENSSSIYSLLLTRILHRRQLLPN